jgi:hypothetical protein
MRLVYLLFGLAGTLLACVVQADEIRPGYLELRQTAADTYDLLFKIPALGEEAGSHSMSTYPMRCRT